MFRKKNDEFFEETDDVLVVFDDEQKTSDISRISSVNEEAIIVTGKYNVPYHDCEITTGPDGRIFFYRAPSESVKETKRLAELERNTVLSQIANYRYQEESGVDISKIALIGVTMMSVLMLGLSSCQG
ncbi:hypothetical protein [Alkalibacillus haloalkaliphilus]|uniref:hypothetical protein n=1 Tax=Alkalibacillus haloalkaliphilus TaxID=94136 RepID=UPI0002E7D2F5|nr:hypothetical protein [Alkalibacillus haloalkaliphilus]